MACCAVAGRAGATVFEVSGLGPSGIAEVNARAARADGVIFLLTKFCDPWAFDYPGVREALDAASIPSLLVEIEQDLRPSAHFSTRIGAFAEMIASRAGFSETGPKRPV